MIQDDDIYNIMTKLSKVHIYQTSAWFLYRFFEERLKVIHEIRDKDMLLSGMMLDIYIKARSYALLNKLFFWMAVPCALAVIVWPSLAIITGEKILDSTILQATLTTGAAFFIYIYRHYKVRQLHAENLMRLVAFSNIPINQLMEKIMDELTRLDQGFSFHGVPKVETDSKKDDTGMSPPKEVATKHDPLAVQ